jgi:hypothetical protein
MTTASIIPLRPGAATPNPSASRAPLTAAEHASLRVAAAAYIFNFAPSHDDPIRGAFAKLEPLQ